ISLFLADTSPDTRSSSTPGSSGALSSELVTITASELSSVLASDAASSSKSGQSTSGKATAGAGVKRKHTTLNLVTKMQIIEEAERDELSYEMIAKKYGVATSSVSRYVKNKNSIRENIEKYRGHGIADRKTMKEPCYPLLEEALYVWVLQERERNMIIPPDVLKAKAEKFFRAFQEQGCYAGKTFTGSDGWLRRFRKRYGLRVLIAAGEKASADVDAYLLFKTVLLNKIVEMGLTKSQVYNADESAIFIKMIASRTVALWDESCASGRKLDKTRFTFMPCCNIDGTMKMKLMFIGTAANPREFSRYSKKLLPVSYYHSKKAWMTRQLFRSWFHEEFIPEVRKFSVQHNLEPKALLVLDNCSAHFDGCGDLRSDDGLIQVIYLPPNVTSQCQPMDQSIINAVKLRYKRKLMLFLVLENINLPFMQRLKKVSLRTSIEWLSSAWNEITSTSIENSWKKLIDEFPEAEWQDTSQHDENHLEDIHSLMASIDRLAETETDDDHLQQWLKDDVRDSDGNPAWFTTEVFEDAEIVKSTLNKSHDPQYEEEEWLEDPPEEDADIQYESQSSSAENSQCSEFQKALDSLDYLIEYVKHDLSEVSKLKLLRMNLIENEWKKRNM
ncbi:jerky protein homolog-like, partial [Aedes albopictus]|uniref:HTH CENPB-type domain-containing protein n=1 Tax=Aedes albopictus TaxID=7160 RepID=A0ABM1Z1U2_AEDAL